MELGGCCLSRHGSFAAVLPSKADRIMSRYRPIAPKPTATSYPPLANADRSVSSSVSANGRPAALDVSRPRRTRKRKADLITSPSKGSKRSAVLANLDSNRERSYVSNGCSVEEKKVVGVSQIDAFSTGGVLGATEGLKSCVSMEATTESSETSVFGIVSAGAAGTISSGLIESTRMIEQDSGFMERAAASAPASVLPERKGRNPGSFGFTEMIRGITRLPSTADVHGLLQQPRSNVEGMPNGCSSSSVAAREGFSVMGAPAFCEQIHVECMDLKQQQEGRSPELVTLRLLPDAPSRADSVSSDSCISTCDLRGQPSQDGKSALARNSGSRTSTSSLFGELVRPATSHLKDSVCDLAFIEQVYGNSSEPVLLADEAQNVLWLNRAYERAYKDAMERRAGTTPLMVPFIDPLGIPTQMGRFHVRIQGRGCLWTVLWGFLKKFVVETGADGAYSPSHRGFSVKEFNSQDHTDTCSPAGDASTKRHYEAFGNADCASANKSVVFVPQPVRLVGSTVSLESITDIQREATRMSGSLDLMKQQLEEGSSPAFITDSSYLVRWVNMAYKQMVGQPECPWLASTVSDSKVGGSPTSPLTTPLLTGEVLLISNVEIPLFASAFSGRANIQWTNAGERNCMTVPCDVSRLDACCSGKGVLVWKFDIEASLRLTCGV